jgi:Asp-tRNA(Asn)/Glu-tRNA(Gln) amidotransferase A subunit family amidase
VSAHLSLLAASSDAWRYALAAFLVLTGIGLVLVLVRLSGTLQRVNTALDGVVGEVVPMLGKVSTSLDHVNDELEKVGHITDHAVDAADSVDTAVRAVSMAIQRPVQKVAGLAAGVGHAAASFRVEHDIRRAIERGKEAAARRERELADQLQAIQAARQQALTALQAERDAALAERDALKQRFLAALDEAGIDALLTPTTQTPAVRVESVDQTTTPAHFTRLGNLLELCALAVPDGFTATGLPLSLQIMCRPYDEATALRIGWAYQQATDWHERHPPGL